MKPNKQAIDISFAKGLDEKTDPKRVPMGNFVSLENTVFQRGGRLTKRNGYTQLPSLPDTTSVYLTNHKENLTAVGTSIFAYSQSYQNWVSKGNIQPLSLSTMPLVRNNFNQTAADTAIASNGLVCVAYVESESGSSVNKYAVYDSTTGQNIISPTTIPPGAGAVAGGMRVFVLGYRFIIVFTNTISAVAHLQYIAIDINNPTNISAPVDLVSSYIPAATLSWDGVVSGSYLYLAYNTTNGGQSVQIISLSNILVASVPVSLASEIATMVSLTADTSSSLVLYLSYYDASSMVGKVATFDSNLALLSGPTTIFSSVALLNITSSANNGSCHIFAEYSNNYSYDSGIPSHFIRSVIVDSSASVTTALYTVARSVGLASKSFYIGSTIYFLASYQSPYQPTYFLINGSLSVQANPIAVAKLAYQNGGGYLTTGLPNVYVNGDFASVIYRFKDLISAVNKDTNVGSGVQTAGVYSQTGINLATFDIGTEAIDSAEIGNDLHISGGFLWMYDGQLPVEHNFFLYPDSVEATWSATGGSIVAKPDSTTNTNAYFYQVTYEWTDNQGNAFRSAPSVPIPVTTTGSGTAGSITVNIPTLRLTYKIASPVKIVVYRWSVAQQIYYQTTSITVPTLNSTTSDSIAFVDTNADATILGNNILYTTGGVVEDIGPPATSIMALFDNRLWLVDAEDANLLWFSKQVIEATPVEMSDLFTMYIAPTTGANTNAGKITALFPMDDKLIIFMENSTIFYINGTGPDNTGANNQYSQPIFITSSVSCTNIQSIVLIPSGLLFQSNKGIWLLDRSLNTSYLGAPVQQSTLTALVKSAQNIPATNQVRFIMDSGITIMYDYYYNEWGTFTGVPAISGTIFDSLHTFLNAEGQIFQESPGSYLDGSRPVLMSFTTGPLRLGDLQGYQRAYFFYLLGEYLSPHQLQVSISYDYSLSPSQSVFITPTNNSGNYGDIGPYGQGNPYGGESSLYDWRIFLERQRCMAFAISIQEIYDAAAGVTAGAGLTLSGINLVCGFKSQFRPQSAEHTAG